MEEFNKLKLNLEKCSKDQDKERRHVDADEIPNFLQKKEKNQLKFIIKYGNTKSKMKNILIIVAFIFLISATAVTTTQIVQPKTPVDVRMFYGSIYEHTIESTLKNYIRLGYVVKSTTLDGGTCLIIVEKY